MPSRSIVTKRPTLPARLPIVFDEEVEGRTAADSARSSPSSCSARRGSTASIAAAEPSGVSPHWSWRLLPPKRAASVPKKLLLSSAEPIKRMASTATEEAEAVAAEDDGGDARDTSEAKPARCATVAAMRLAPPMPAALSLLPDVKCEPTRRLWPSLPPLRKAASCGCGRGTEEGARLYNRDIGDRPNANVDDSSSPLPPPPPRAAAGMRRFGNAPSPASSAKASSSKASCDVRPRPTA